MLPRNYRISAYNDTGASADVTVTARRWKFDSSGAVVYEASEATLLSAIGLADAGFSTGTAQDNTTDAYIGAVLLVSTTGSGTAGVITLFVEGSTDAGTTWPDAQEGVPVGSVDAGDTATLTV